MTKNKTRIERQESWGSSSSSSAPRRIVCDFLLPLQVTLLMLSGLFVMQMVKSTYYDHLEQNTPVSPSRRLRQTQASFLNNQQKRAVIGDLQKLYEGTKLDKDYVQEILRDGRQLLSEIETIYDVPLPTIPLEENPEASKKGITIVGDIHGDFLNLIHLFKINGFPSLDRPYIFNGDFTDRGEQSLHCLLGLLLIKRYCNGCIHLNTGNHETIYFYGTTLKNQTMEMYDLETWTLVRDVLLQLPLASVVDNRIFVIHGGIPSIDFELDDLRHYKRGRDMDETTMEGYFFRRSVWSDPYEDDDDESAEDKTEDSTTEESEYDAKDEDDDEDDDLTDEQKAKEKAQQKADQEARIAKFANYTFEVDIENDDDRGWFDEDVTEAFLEKNHLEYIVRAHQSFSPGYDYQHNGKVITIHSFPKTADQNGAYMNIYSNDKSMHVEQFAGLKFSSINHQSKVDWRTL